MITWLFVTALFWMGLLAGYLAYDKRYEDGFVGHTSLVVMAMSGVLQFLMAVLDEPYFSGVLPCVFVVAAAVFMSRHVCNFWRHRAESPVKKGMA